jgi:triphosphatase
MDEDRAMSNTDFELKLRVAREDLARIKSSSLLKRGGRGRLFETVYFDTADLRLKNRNASLRVRKQGNRYVQNIKANSVAPANRDFKPREWEWSVSEARPDLSTINDDEAVERLGKVAVDELEPVFTSRIKRTVQRLENGKIGGSNGSAVAVAIDEGEIVGPDGSALSVAEVELKDGETPALFDIALALNAVAPVRLETRSKAQRGYALVAGETPTAVHAAPVRLSSDDTVEQAIETITRHCLDHLVANEELMLQANDPVALHQMRVALRRMRSVFSLFRPWLPPRQYEFFAAEAKWLAQSLASARDCDVFIAELLVPIREAFAGDASTAALEEAARARRAAGYRLASEAVRSSRYTTFLLKLGRWLEAKGWREQPVSERSVTLLAPIRALASRMLSKRHKRARGNGARIAALSSEARHELRIALKKLRYAMEFFGSLFDRSEVDRCLKRVTKLQTTLGHLNDVATASVIVSQLERQSVGETKLPWAAAAGKLVGWHARGTRELEPQLIADWRIFAAMKPFWR